MKLVVITSDACGDTSLMRRSSTLKKCRLRDLNAICIVSLHLLSIRWIARKMRLFGKETNCKKSKAIHIQNFTERTVIMTRMPKMLMLKHVKCSSARVVTPAHVVKAPLFTVYIINLSISYMTSQYKICQRLTRTNMISSISTCQNLRKRRKSGTHGLKPVRFW